MEEPNVKPKTSKKVPIHFPNINPPIKIIGVAKPKRIVQMIHKIKNKKDERKKLLFLTLFRLFLFSLIISKLEKSLIEK